jgi:hypothetical protein
MSPTAGPAIATDQHCDEAGDHGNRRDPDEHADHDFEHIHEVSRPCTAHLRVSSTLDRPSAELNPDTFLLLAEGMRHSVAPTA